MVILDSLLCFNSEADRFVSCLLIKTLIKDAKADGKITKTEAKEIRQERREVNEAIRRAKHNNKTR